jgi:pimeloyl-ACP methyl ester carboxylesterase
VEKKYAELTNGITYAFVDVGEGPAVLLLHGFPDSAYMWRHQIPVLVDAGFRVVAPDLRGFGDSSKPHPIEAYKLQHVVGDIAALMRALSIPRAHVVAHDWGAAVAWILASVAQPLVDHLCVLSVGHPSVFSVPTLEQRVREWYMLLYQFEDVAEELLRRDDWELMRQMMGHEEDFAVWKRELAKPGALRAGLNYYRANRSPAMQLEPPPRFPFVMAPTLGIWSDGDLAMVESAMVQSAGFVKGSWEYHCVSGAGHWIPVDAPDEVNALLLGFLGRRSAARPTARLRRSF